MNKWFDETFLPSIFNRTGVEKITWITAKQCDVVRRYFNQYEQFTMDSGIGIYHRTCLTYQWQGRKLTLWVENNGAGRICFGQNEAEKQIMIESVHKKENERFENHVQRMARKHPDKLAKELEELVKTYKDLQYWKAEEPEEFDEEDEKQLADYCIKIQIVQKYI